MHPQLKPSTDPEIELPRSPFTVGQEITHGDGTKVINTPEICLQKYESYIRALIQLNRQGLISQLERIAELALRPQGVKVPIYEAPYHRVISELILEAIRTD